MVARQNNCVIAIFDYTADRVFAFIGPADNFVHNVFELIFIVFLIPMSRYVDCARGLFDIADEAGLFSKRLPNYSNYIAPECYRSACFQVDLGATSNRTAPLKIFSRHAFIHQRPNQCEIGCVGLGCNLRKHLRRVSPSRLRDTFNKHRLRRNVWVRFSKYRF